MSDTSRYYEMSITDSDRPYMPFVLDHPVELARMLHDVGCSPAITQGILGWLTIRAHGVLDNASNVTRVKYRDWLDKVTAEFAPPPPGRRERDPVAECRRVERALRQAARRLDAAPAAILPLRARRRVIPG